MHIIRTMQHAKCISFGRCYGHVSVCGVTSFDSIAIGYHFSEEFLTKNPIQQQNSIYLVFCRIQYGAWSSLKVTFSHVTAFIEDNVYLLLYKLEK